MTGLADITPSEWIGYGTGALQMALAGLVLWSRPQARINQAFALFLGISGAIWFVPGTYFFVTLGTSISMAPAIIARQGFAMLDEVAALFFIGAFLGRPRALMGPHGWWFFLVPAGVLIAGLIATGEIMGGAAIDGLQGAMFSRVDRILYSSVNSVAPFWLAWFALRTPGRQGSSAALLAAALGAWFFAGSMVNALDLPKEIAMFSQLDASDQWSVAAYSLRISVMLAALAFLFMGARRHSDTGLTARTFAAFMYGAAGLFGLVAGTWIESLRQFSYSIPLLIGTLVMAYTVVRWQREGIDLQVKWTLNRGTVASVFLAVFFVVAVVAENLLTNNMGPWVGGVAAGLLLFAITPLQRLGERIANAAMPAVEDTPAYHAARKDEIYRAAYEAAMQDGELRDKERDMLATLQENLGLRPTQARAIEKSMT